MQSGLESSELAKKKIDYFRRLFLQTSHSEVGSKRSLTPVCQQYQQRGLELQTT